MLVKIFQKSLRVPGKAGKTFISLFLSSSFLSKWFWKTRDSQNWNYQQTFLKRFERQKECTEKYFIPHLKMTDQILDLGCSDGSCTAFLIAKYCHQIDGFDISNKLVEAANDRAAKEGIRATFKVADLENFSKLEKVYNHAMMMGLLTCIISDEHLLKILRILNRGLKLGAIVALKDSLANSKPMIVKQSGYAAHYRMRTDYLDFFKKAGFILLAEEVLGDSSIDEVSSYFFTIKKIEECSQLF